MRLWPLKDEVDLREFVPTDIEEKPTRQNFSRAPVAIRILLRGPGAHAATRRKGCSGENWPERPTRHAAARRTALVLQRAGGRGRADGGAGALVSGTHQRFRRKKKRCWLGGTNRGRRRMAPTRARASESRTRGPKGRRSIGRGRGSELEGRGQVRAQLASARNGTFRAGRASPWLDGAGSCPPIHGKSALGTEAARSVPRVFGWSSPAAHSRITARPGERPAWFCSRAGDFWLRLAAFSSRAASLGKTRWTTATRCSGTWEDTARPSPDLARRLWRDFIRAAMLPTGPRDRAWVVAGHFPDLEVALGARALGRRGRTARELLEPGHR